MKNLWELRIIKKKLTELIGYGGIGGFYWLCEALLVYFLVDRSGFMAWKVVTGWVLLGVYPRYLLHKWWFTDNWLKRFCVRVIGGFL